MDARLKNLTAAQKTKLLTLLMDALDEDTFIYESSHTDEADAILTYAAELRTSGKLPKFPAPVTPKYKIGDLVRVVSDSIVGEVESSRVHTRGVHSWVTYRLMIIIGQQRGGFYETYYESDLVPGAMPMRLEVGNHVKTLASTSYTLPSLENVGMDEVHTMPAGTFALIAEVIDWGLKRERARRSYILDVKGKFTGVVSEWDVVAVLPPHNHFEAG